MHPLYTAFITEHTLPETNIILENPPGPQKEMNHLPVIDFQELLLLVSVNRKHHDPS